jgi:hypothetical protein
MSWGAPLAVSSSRAAPSNPSMMKGYLYHPAFLRIASMLRFATPENDLSKKAKPRDC